MFSLRKTAIWWNSLSQKQDFDFSLKANWFSHVKFTMHSSASIFTLKKGQFSLNFLQLSVVWQPYLEVIRQVILQKLVNTFETLAPKLSGKFCAFLKKHDSNLQGTTELSLCTCSFKMMYNWEIALFRDFCYGCCFLEIHLYRATN